MAISYFPAVSGGSGTWGSITGTLSNQTDLQNALDAKQATLVSGTNIKTINSTSLLGSGNITISGSVADGDKGDITVSGSGATWTIDNDAVTTAKILNSNVTLAKIEDIATNHFLGRHAGGSGAVQQVSASQARTILNVEDGADVTDNANVITALNNIASVTEGDILYYNGSNWVRLALGTDGQVLTATATTVNWENASGGGNIFQTVTASTVGDDGIDYDNGNIVELVLDASIDFDAKVLETSIDEGNTLTIYAISSGSYNIDFTTNFTNSKLGGSLDLVSGERAKIEITNIDSTYYLFLNDMA